MGIHNFKHKGLEGLFVKGSKAGVPANAATKLSLLLLRLAAAAEPKDLEHPPGLRLHQLKGERTGTWSLTVTGNWRLTFRFEGGNAFDVDFEDYH